LIGAATGSVIYSNFYGPAQLVSISSCKLRILRSLTVPLLVSLIDHGNQNTRMWARAALSRKRGEDFQQDKLAWDKWWQAQGHDPIDGALPKPWSAPSPAPQ
jgi:hypothetical protein